MRPVSLALVAIAGFLAAPVLARADVFNFQGTLSPAVDGGTSISGQFGFNFATQTITSFDFTVPGDTLTSTQAGSTDSVFAFTGTGPTGSFLVLNFNSGDGTFLNLVVSNPMITQFFETVGFGGSENVSLYQCTSLTCVTSGDNLLGDVVSASVSPVPEPASLAIFGTALAGLGLLRRRRRRNV